MKPARPRVNVIHETIKIKNSFSTLPSFVGGFGTLGFFANIMNDQKTANRKCVIFWAVLEPRANFEYFEAWTQIRIDSGYVPKLLFNAKRPTRIVVKFRAISELNSKHM